VAAESAKSAEKLNKEKERENMNIRAARIHLIGDGIQCLGVLIAAIIIYCNPEYKIADPITTFVFAILVICVTTPLFIDCIKILMEYAPDLETKEIYQAILNVST